MTWIRVLLLALLVPLFGCSGSGTLQLGANDDDASDDDDAADDDDASADDDDATSDDDDATSDDDDSYPDFSLFEGEWAGEFVLVGEFGNGEFAFCEGEAWVSVYETGELDGWSWCWTQQNNEFWAEIYGDIENSGELLGQALLFRGDKDLVGENKVRGDGVVKRSIEFGWEGVIIRGNGQELPYRAEGVLEPGEGDWGDDDDDEN